MATRAATPLSVRRRSSLSMHRLTSAFEYLSEMMWWRRRYALRSYEDEVPRPRSGDSRIGISSRAAIILQW